MPRVVRVDPTPNPDALKFVTDGVLADPPRSYRSPAEAPGRGEDPLAAALFAETGVAAVLISGTWVTVNKVRDADWKGLRDRVKRAIERPDDSG